MGAGASSSSAGELVIGDVVTVKLPHEAKRVIGIVTVVQDGLFTVQVSSSESLGAVPKNDIEKIAPWNEIEVGDIVKVREEDSTLYYEANVISRNEDGTFKVRFGEDDVEDHITCDRMLKLMSGRLELKERMMVKDTSGDT